MARPINPTPDLKGQDAREFLEEMKRIERGDLTPEEIEFREKFHKSLEDRIIPLGKRI